MDKRICVTFSPTHNYSYTNALLRERESFEEDVSLDDESMSRVFSKRDDLFCEIFFPKRAILSPSVYSSASRGRERVYEQTKQTLTCVTISFILSLINNFYRKKRWNAFSAKSTPRSGKGPS